MSLFGALDTAVSGLDAQSAAFSNISDNIANSQTTGFKGTNTSFADYLSTSTATTNDSGTVVATPEYQNQTQGAVSASTNTLAMAIDGQGYFQVAQTTGTGSSTTLNTTQAEYSRDGDFSLDSLGYMVNGSGQALEGYIANPTTGILNESQVQPIQISQTAIPPVVTANVTLSANLPATPASGTATSASPLTSQIDVYDAQGTEHSLTLSYAQTTSNNWTVNATDANGAAVGTGAITFNADGSLATGGTVALTPTFNGVVQNINLNVGAATGSAGVTQYAGTTYTANSLSQDGAPSGAYSGVNTQSNGNVVITYANGATKIVANVPVAQFANVNALQRQNGQGFIATNASGAANLTTIANASGTTLTASATEGSNVDIATEFTKLIVAQQAYAANSKVVTTANDMMTTTLNMKQ
jgi:flagellar hook protein FlgE